MTGLNIKDLNVYYDKGTSSEKHVLKNFNLKCNPGEITLVKGRSGAGKSTLFRAILGLEPLVSGSIKINGESISKLTRPKSFMKIGYLDQDSLKNLAPNLTVVENIIFSMQKLNSIKIYKNNLTQRAAEFIGQFDIMKNVNSEMKVINLSGGQRQLLSLTISMLSPMKEIYLIDEFGSAMDEHTKESALRILKKIVNKNSSSTLIIDHDTDMVAKYSEKIYSLNN